jgi:hypothetical protein
LPCPDGRSGPGDRSAAGVRDRTGPQRHRGAAGELGHFGARLRGRQGTTTVTDGLSSQQVNNVTELVTRPRRHSIRFHTAEATAARPGTALCQRVARGHASLRCTQHHDASDAIGAELRSCGAEHRGGGGREGVARPWHARGQGFKSPQLHQWCKAFLGLAVPAGRSDPWLRRTGAPTSSVIGRAIAAQLCDGGIDPCGWVCQGCRGRSTLAGTPTVS